MTSDGLGCTDPLAGRARVSRLSRSVDVWMARPIQTNRTSAVVRLTLGALAICLPGEGLFVSVAFPGKLLGRVLIELLLAGGALLIARHR